jgi:hypothetical protein
MPFSTPFWPTIRPRGSPAKPWCRPGLVVISGEITTKAHINYREIAQEAVRRIGYDNSDIGFDYKSCAILTAINRQSPDIAQGVNEGQGIDLDQGAGDQGLMFGYACNETASLMPLPIHYAHRIMQRQAEVRRDGRLPWLRPDAKSQLTVRYVDGGRVDRHHRRFDAARSGRLARPDLGSGDRGGHQAGTSEGTADLPTPATWSTRPGASSSAARTATAA